MFGGEKEIKILIKHNMLIRRTLWSWFLGRECFSVTIVLVEGKALTHCVNGQREMPQKRVIEMCSYSCIIKTKYEQGGGAWKSVVKELDSQLVLGRDGIPWKVCDLEVLLRPSFQSGCPDERRDAECF